MNQREAWLHEVRSRRMTGGWTRWKPYYGVFAREGAALQNLPDDRAHMQYRAALYVPSQPRARKRKK